MAFLPLKYTVLSANRVLVPPRPYTEVVLRATATEVDNLISNQVSGSITLRIPDVAAAAQFQEGKQFLVTLVEVPPSPELPLQ